MRQHEQLIEFVLLPCNSLIGNDTWNHTQVQSLQRRMLLGSAGAGRKESKRNIDIYRDICCQLIQDHVLIQPESHAE